MKPTGVKTFRNERAWSRVIASKVQGTITVENSVQAGTPDLCLPTKNGWRWVELKLFYAGTMILKKSQLASTSKESRMLPPTLQRTFVVIDREGLVLSLRGWEVLELPRRPSSNGVVVDLPADGGACRLDDFLVDFGCSLE